MIRFTPILLAVLYAFVMYRFSVWRTRRELDAHSTELADPRLQDLLVERTLKELESLDSETLHSLHNADAVKVTSAFPLSKSSQAGLEAALGKLEMKEDPQLLAGIALQAGDCYLGANLKDELEVFRRAALA